MVGGIWLFVSWMVVSFCWLDYINSVGVYAFFAYYTVALGFGLFGCCYAVIISGFGFCVWIGGWLGWGLIVRLGWVAVYYWFVLV